MFVVQLSVAGEFSFATAVSCTRAIKTGQKGLFVDDDYAYLVGQFSGVATFGSTSLTSKGDTDIFLAKLDNREKTLWAKAFGGEGIDTANGVVVDVDKNIYIAGQFSDIARFGRTLLSSKGRHDLLVMKLESTGKVVWANAVGSINADSATSIVTDNKGSLYISAFFNEVASFGPVTFKARGNADPAIAKLSTSGTWLGAIQMGSKTNELPFAIALDKQGSVYLAGYLTAEGIFGRQTRKHVGGNDLFVAKYQNLLCPYRKYSLCNNICTNVKVDHNNCGRCDHVCSSKMSCLSGVCQ